MNAHQIGKTFMALFGVIILISILLIFVSTYVMIWTDPNPWWTEALWQTGLVSIFLSGVPVIIASAILEDSTW